MPSGVAAKTAAANNVASITGPSQPKAADPKTNSTATAVNSSSTTPAPSTGSAATTNTIKTNADVEAAQKAYDAAALASQRRRATM